MKKNIIILFLTICFFNPIFIVAQKKGGNDTIPESQIKKSIQTFANLIDSQDVQEFGLKSVAELKSLKPGKQFRKFMIGLNDIKKYKPGEDVRKIIKEYLSIEVSLVDKAGKIRTSIEFVKNKGNWEASRYGSTPELKILSNAQTALGASFVKKGDLIRIPALQINFIAVASAAVLEFISLEDNQKLKLKKGEKLTSSEAILRLVPLANKHNGLPN